jgi:hypothetical protein
VLPETIGAGSAVKLVCTTGLSAKQLVVMAVAGTVAAIANVLQFKQTSRAAKQVEFMF